MRVAPPTNPEHSDLGLVALRVPTRELRALDDVRFPVAESNGEFLVHLSSLVYVHRLPEYRGYTDDALKSRVREFVAESARTFRGDGRLAPLDGGYRWESLFTDAWMPLAYQKAGMERIYHRLLSYTPGVINADKWGLGKTIQAIGVFERLRAETFVAKGSPIVVVTMSSLVAQWADEIERFAASRPFVVPVLGDSATRRRKLGLTRDGRGPDYVVTHYELWRLPQYRQAIDAFLARAPLGAVGLDETVKITNAESATSLVIRALVRSSRYSIQFNATPIENSLMDFWTLCHIANPHAIGSLEWNLERHVKAWGFRYRGGANKFRVSNERRPRLFRRLGEFRNRAAILFVRRTHSEVAIQMPQVVSEVRRVEMSPEQDRAYRAVVSDFTAMPSIAEMAKVQRAALAADTSNAKSPSAKIDDLVELLESDLSDERIVVFSRFRACIEYAAKRLRAYRPMQIHGGVPIVDRNLARRRFESPDGVGRVLLCTEAGNYGLNLQAAGVVVNLDLPWNASKLGQRIGRVARIKQTRSRVLVINYAVAFARTYGRTIRTIDDYFLATVVAKRDLFREVFSDDNVDEVGDDEALSVSAVAEYLRGSTAPVRPDRRRKTNRRVRRLS